MKAPILICTALSLFALTACQTTPKQYDGISGYQIESSTGNTATLSYTLAGHTKQEQDAKKMQRACQDALGKHKNYQINVINTQEIIAPSIEQSNNGVKLGTSRTSIGFSTSPSNNNIDEYATRQALDVKPSTLKVIQFTCK